MVATVHSKTFFHVRSHLIVSPGAGDFLGVHLYTHSIIKHLMLDRTTKWTILPWFKSTQHHVSYRIAIAGIFAREEVGDVRVG